MLKPTDLQTIAATNLSHYSERAESFWQGTRDHDVSQNILSLLQHIQAPPPFSLLDFGCGPGRDLKKISDLGHRVIGLDGVTRFAQMARDYSGCEVWEQDFLALDLPQHSFDGIYANASLFHVPTQELPRILLQLHASLKPQGVLFSSNPRGSNTEGWHDGRYGVYHDLDGWRQYLTTAGFVELNHYYRPAGLPRDQQPWLASLWRKS
jgi:SAM-dependent methyltransferase